MFAEVAKIGEVAVNSAEKLSEIKEVELKEIAEGQEILSPDLELIKNQSLESLSQYNTDGFIEAAEAVQPEYRALSEAEMKALREATNMSEAALKKCSINEDGDIRLTCINESMAGMENEVGVCYVEKVVNINGVEITIVVPEFPSCFEITVPDELLQADDEALFRHCTLELQEAIKQDPELASKFTPNQLEQIETGAPRISGWTWHHAEECGRMQLVQTKIHEVSRHTGGKSIWGGGR